MRVPSRVLPTLALVIGFGCLAVAGAPPNGNASKGNAPKDDASKGKFPPTDKTNLRLVPFPKRVESDGVEGGSFKLDRKLVLEAPGEVAELAGRLIGAELKRAGLPAPKVVPLKDHFCALRLSAKPGEPWPGFMLRGPDTPQEDITPEDYTLGVETHHIHCGGGGQAGLLHGVHTLCQLIRANRRDKALPCLGIVDWPSLRWRCFQDDLTRGPSSTLKTLKQHVDLGAALKMNLFTYYMEYQYAFKKHPLIGPKNGSLTPEDLAAVVEYAQARHVDVLGNQQSFGHFEDILKHQQYAHLRETSNLLCPVKEESYRLLDDLYSEVCPLLPFEMFNVCCDETWGLGKGPSKELAEKIGIGGVYVQHIRRVHELLKTKYNKRMMMWGDIILQHPGKLEQIPKDTVMLTWGYGPRESFQDQIVPFARSGYEFFVCPGINNWSRILPDFGATLVNVRNFVRDGARHGALGMLNTAWEDDGEALQGYKWHGYAWGAECAWNASKTTPELFHRRIGAVLFGERGDHFGRAIELLAGTHRLPGMQGMNNRRFWQDDFSPQRGPAATRASAGKLLKIVRPAIEHLQQCKSDATVNAALLDYFLFGARRMELIGTRMLDGLETAKAYTAAYELSGKEKDKDKILALLAEAEKLVSSNRDAHQGLGREFQRLWLAESKPYALDRTMRRYAEAVRRYDEMLRRLAEARRRAEADKPLPRPDELRLALPEAFTRRTRPQKIVALRKRPEPPWAKPPATYRFGVVVSAGEVDRYGLPIEVDVTLPAGIASKPVRAFCCMDQAKPKEILAQLDPVDTPDKARLSLLIPGPLAKESQAVVLVFPGLDKPGPPLPQAVSTRTGPDGMVWIENDKLRLLLGPEGGHVYRWEVKALDDRDLTMPGRSGWAGFSDLARGHRHTPHKLVCTGRGPAVVRYVCTDSEGLVKTIRLFGGASWMEVVLAEPTGHYWDFDDPQNFAADGRTPGVYLFSNGVTGPVGKESDGVPAQRKAGGVYWGLKYNRQKLALGLITPEVAAVHHVAPGAGAGGVGIEGSPAACHFVTFAGVLPAQPAEAMTRLRQTLDFRHQPDVVLEMGSGFVSGRLERR